MSAKAAPSTATRRTSTCSSAFYRWGYAMLCWYRSVA